MISGINSMKNKLNKLLQNELVIFFGIVIVVVFIYVQSIFNFSILARDDSEILDSLRPVSSITSYFNFFFQKKIIDIQPIRDLSLIIDIHISRYFNIQTYHFTNLLIFIVLLYGCKELFKRFNFSKSLSLVLTFLLAIHPVFVGSVCWISARKHLLSCMFIIFATIISKKPLAKKNYFLIPILYIFSILSQPITLLWPVWLIILSIIEKNTKKLLIAIACLPFLVTVFCLNALYYHKPGQGVVNLFTYKIGNYALGIGRGFFQIAIPYKYSTTYYQGSFYNIIGIFLVVSFFYLCYKKISLNNFFLLLSFYFFTLILSLQYFVYDTYLIIPCIAFFILIGHFKQYFQLWHKVFTSIIVASITIYLILITRSHIPMWKNEFALTEKSFMNEPSPQAGVLYGQELFKNDYTEKAFEVALFVYNNFKLSSIGLETLFSKSLLYHPSIPSERKILLIEQYNNRNHWYQHFKGMIYYQAGKKDQALKILIDNLENYKIFEDQSCRIFAEIFYLCKTSTDYKSLNCETKFNRFLKKAMQEGFVIKDYDMELQRIEHNGKI